jgi:hypothetical protein
MATKARTRTANQNLKRRPRQEKVKMQKARKIPSRQRVEMEALLKAAARLQ